ncbi:hypothetical protein ACIBL3_02685 [Kribbella sp. NPDC050124]|uniref:hypothetical protein n=1 Tax=Kribbella sp. NPDC050124 TaxID=3364114 RepID=UPI00379F8541
MPGSTSHQVFAAVHEVDDEATAFVLTFTPGPRSTAPSPSDSAGSCEMLLGFAVCGVARCRLGSGSVRHQEPSLAAVVEVDAEATAFVLTFTPGPRTTASSSGVSAGCCEILLGLLCAE